MAPEGYMRLKRSSGYTFLCIIIAVRQWGIRWLFPLQGTTLLAVEDRKKSVDVHLVPVESQVGLMVFFCLTLREETRFSVKD